MPLTFLNSWLLLGTALVAVPIVLHLIMRQKPKRFEFPALRFIAKRHEANRRRLRLRHLLLLLLRAGAIALLAFALAGPRLTVSGMLASQEAPVAAALVFDTAPRMQYKQDNQTRLEVAQELGVWLLAQLPRESQIAVLDTRLGEGVFQADLGAARDRVQKLETVTNSQALSAVVDEALRLVSESELPRKEVYIFSDLSRSAWPTHSVARLQDRITDVPGVGIYVIDVGVENPVNYALGDVRLSAQVLSNRSPLGIETELSRTGASESGSSEPRTVELYLLDDNDQPKKRGEQSCTLQPGRAEQVEFGVRALGVGTHQGYLQIVGQDGLAWDDRRYFTVEVKPAWRILVAAPKPASRYALFLTQALAPTEFRQRGQARFDCDVAELDELLDRALDDYAAVCLLDPTPLPPETWQKLSDFVTGGGGLAIFLGRNARPEDAFNQSAPRELLPGKLLRQVRRPEGDCYLAPRDYQHPILSAFRSQAGSIPWQDFPVFLYWQLDMAPAGASTVLRFNNGQPALVERSLGNGRVLTMTTPISDSPNAKPWNLLPVGLYGGEAGVFVILANQMMAHLVGSSEQQLNYVAGERVVLPLDLHSQRGTYLVTGPDEISFSAPADLEKHQLEISREIDKAGNYRVEAGGTTSGISFGFSVNLAPEQTDLQRMEPGELAEVFGKFPFRVARTREQIDRDISTTRVGPELFAAAILAVALVLLAEHLVANRFYREG